MLAYFRSQHNNQTWLAALTAILDTTSLVITYLRGPCKKQAELTFAMARHAVVDLSIIFDVPSGESFGDRLPPAVLAQLKFTLSEFGYLPSKGVEEDIKLQDLRDMCEPYLYSLAGCLGLVIPPWMPGKTQVDNWLTNPWETIDSGSKSKVRGTRHRHRHF